LVIILRIINHLALYTPLANPPESIESGNYGNPPSAIWWFKQSLLYFISLSWMKICVFFVIQMLPFIVKVGDWALRWTEGNTAIQIIFVMLLFPVIMNAIQYYIIDTFIKKRIPVDDNSLDEIHDAMLDDDPHRRSALLAAISDDEESDLDDNSIIKSVQFRSQPKATATHSNSVEKTSVEMDSEDVSPSSSSATLGRRRDEESSS
jgi:STIMATE family protein